jgi:hypothetical protein
MHGLSSLIIFFVPISGFTCNVGPWVIAQKTPRLLRSPPMEQEPSALGRPRWGLGGGFWTSIKHCGGMPRRYFTTKVSKMVYFLCAIQWNKCFPLKHTKSQSLARFFMSLGMPKILNPRRLSPGRVCTSQTSTLQPHAGANNHLYG